MQQFTTGNLNMHAKANIRHHLIPLAALLFFSVPASAPDYRYDALGRLRQAIHPGGLTLNYRYDAAGSLAGIIETITPLYDLAGTVRDSSAAPLPGAAVRVNDYAAVADVQGRYRLPGLPGGECHVSATLKGYIFPPQTIILNADHSGTLDLGAEQKPQEGSRSLPFSSGPRSL